MKRLLTAAACVALTGACASAAALAAPTAPAAPAVSPSATLVWHGFDADKVGKVYEAGPDGAKDAHFTLIVDSGGSARVVKQLLLRDGSSGYWDTVPQGSWSVLAVERGGKRLNPKDELIADPVSGRAVYELYAADYGPFGNTATDSVYIEFADGTKISSGHPGALVPAAPAAGAAATTATAKGAATTAVVTVPRASSTVPDTAKQVPDFWVALSASVITKGTLGLGRDLALTSGATNNQVLTVQVLERASGCLIEGAWVELRDPDGNPVPGARVQTRDGTAYVGGLRLRTPGLYHLWVTARDAMGGVVMQSWLPLQVKDRKGAAFETLNGRSFSFVRGEWVEGARTTAVRSTQAAGGVDLFGPIVAVFQQIVQGIAHSVLGPAQKAKAASAVTILGDRKTASTVRVQQAQAKAGALPAYLVTGPAQPAEARAADVSPDRRIRLIGNDGAGLIGNDGAGLIGNDGAGLITNDGGSLITNDGGSLIANVGGALVAAGGNVISNDGAGAVARGTQSAGRALAASTCLAGAKPVGPGRVFLVDGSPVLAGPGGRLAAGTLLIGGRNAMPVNGLAK